MAGDLLQHLRSTVRREEREYEQGADRPLGGYLAAMGVYTGLTAGGALLVRARRRPLPDRVSWSDVALLAVATHKASRLLAKDVVTSPLRAPFTRFEGPAGDAELREQVRDDGARQTVGELVNCPFCLAQWVATGFGFGLLLAPRLTRLVATVFAVRTGSDFLQLAYAAAQRGAEG